MFITSVFQLTTQELQAIKTEVTSQRGAPNFGLRGRLFTLGLANMLLVRSHALDVVGWALFSRAAQGAGPRLRVVK